MFRLVRQVANLTKQASLARILAQFLKKQL